MDRDREFARFREGGKTGKNRAKALLGEYVAKLLKHEKDRKGPVCVYIDTCNLKKDSRSYYIKLFQPDLVCLLHVSAEGEGGLEVAQTRAMMREEHPLFSKENRTKALEFIGSCLEVLELPELNETRKEKTSSSIMNSVINSSRSRSSPNGYKQDVTVVSNDSIYDDEANGIHINQQQQQQQVMDRAGFGRFGKDMFVSYESYDIKLSPESLFCSVISDVGYF